MSFDAQDVASDTADRWFQIRRLWENLLEGWGSKLSFLVRLPFSSNATVSPVLNVERKGRRLAFDISDEGFEVGGSSPCDFIIPGAPAGLLFRVTLAPGARGRLAYVTALKSGVLIDDEPLTEGDIVSVHKGETIICHDVRFTLDGVASPPLLPAALKLPTSGAKRTNLASAVGLCILSVLLFGYGFVRLIPADSGPPEVAATAPAKMTISELLTELREALLTSRIDAQVRLARTGRSIEVDATNAALDADGERRLQAILAVLQRTSDIPIEDVSGPSPTLGQTIAAVATSPVRVAIDRDGRTYRIGDTIGGAWKILSIEPDALTVVRRHIKAKVLFAPAGRRGTNTLQTPM